MNRQIEFFKKGRLVIWSGGEKEFFFESGEYDQLLNIFTIEDNSYFFKRDREKLAMYQIDREKDNWRNLEFEPQYFDTEYLLQEKTQELTFEDFKANIQSQFK